jgi:DNA-binding transcriptional LysR family regulator
LRYFVAVAEMENVSRAALKLHVSQPALSRQIRDLEDEIGFCLLERTAKSVRLTEVDLLFLSWLPKSFSGLPRFRLKTAPDPKGTPLRNQGRGQLQG